MGGVDTEREIEKKYPGTLHATKRRARAGRVPDADSDRRSAPPGRRLPASFARTSPSKLWGAPVYPAMTTLYVDAGSVTGAR